jgi:sigma-B regulation protein RsbU (phosphoserine phosphatase)
METSAISGFRSPVINHDPGMHRVSGTTATPRVLIADDLADVVEALRMLLKDQGYEIHAVGSPAAILSALEEQAFDLLLMDLNYTRDTTSGREGLDLLSHIRALDGKLPVVVMTAWGTVELAVDAMHRGVDDFVLKPWDNTRLLEVLRKQIREGRERRKPTGSGNDELEQAGEIQRGFLPREIPQLPGYEFAAAWQPALVVSGDYFDVEASGENQISLCIADVMGKGMPAALLMSNLQATLKAAWGAGIMPRELCSKVNRIVCGNVSPGTFITLFYCVLDAAQRRLLYTNAGHVVPILVRRDGSHMRLQAGGPPLGLFPNGSYEQGELQFESGDRLVLYTDGVTEARNPKAEEFGDDRLIRALKESRSLSAPAMQEKLLEAVSKFSARGFEDDATIVVMSVK